MPASEFFQNARPLTLKELLVFTAGVAGVLCVFWLGFTVGSRMSHDLLKNDNAIENM
ncbi:hypothetical protein DPMN_055870 [Dreissena polymorpha]|uniref:Uncharacterized protein n=1 Tax=Dreissena polymorpha TaxID=45954 RepID=A0A9D4CSK6_DREPO|nr:hypothetical protein DPMN_055870 [Dreissena polymorpha]